MIRLIAIALAASSALSGTAALAAAPHHEANAEHNAADLVQLVRIVEEGYAGFPTKVTDDNRAEYEVIKSSMLANSDDLTAGQLYDRMRTYVDWFDDGHLQLDLLSDNIPGKELTTDLRPAPLMRDALDTDAARAVIDALGADRAPIEGLWSLGSNYDLVILRHADHAGVYEARIIDARPKIWRRPGAVMGVFTETSAGTYNLDLRNRDFSPEAYEAFLEGNALRLDDGGRFTRDYPAGAEGQPLGAEWAIEPFGEDAVLVRAPSMSPRHIETVKSLVTDNADLLAERTYMIIDVRNNGGGGDATYSPLIDYLYTQPMIEPLIEFRDSEVHVEARRAQAEEAREEGDDDSAAYYDGVADKLEANDGEWMRFDYKHDFWIRTRDHVLRNPQQVAILIDNSASSAEQLILDAMQSRKVTLYGQRDSAGALDLSNMAVSYLPSDRYAVAWATSRSNRLPEWGIDGKGIAPDVRIPADVSNPVGWALDHLKSGACRFGCSD
ncbi:S41 family peptidase [Sphingomicrobium arenosum]|uniref:S41 family peptidase n=1 Tax=Sphingomicrobium arenosum TaxID=2233861 RepID=UPI00223F810E|nr:S41 family peptidase [Sphingomicrobium arenosum]